MDRTSLTRAATFYLQRYPSSKENLRQVLQRKIRKIRKLSPDDASMVDAVVMEMEAAGLIDDAGYARGIVHSALSTGRSVRFAQQKLSRLGVAQTHIDAAVELVEDDAEYESARRYAQRCRLGPYRIKEVDDERLQRQKDLEKMSRRGFQYDVASRVLDEAVD